MAAALKGQMGLSAEEQVYQNFTFNEGCIQRNKMRCFMQGLRKEIGSLRSVIVAGKVACAEGLMELRNFGRRKMWIRKKQSIWRILFRDIVTTGNRRSQVKEDGGRRSPVDKIESQRQKVDESCFEIASPRDKRE